MTRGPVNRAELDKLPYLRRDLVPSRSVPILPYWDGHRWSVWMVTEDGRLRELNPRDSARSDYIASSPALDTDLYISFVDFMWQRATEPDIRGVFDATRADFHSLAASTAKVDHFFESTTEAALGGAAFVATELDYLLILARRVFDHVHELVARMWRNGVELSDPALEKRRRQRSLPSSFADLVLDKGLLRTAEQITERYALPISYSEACERIGPFFQVLRRARDEIVHGLKEPAHVFRTTRGWCVNPGQSPFSGFKDVWRDEHRFNEKLYSLRPMLAYVVINTISSCCVLLDAFSTQITFPEPMAPGYHVYIRGPHNVNLGGLLDVARGGSPWWA